MVQVCDSVSVFLFCFKIYVGCCSTRIRSERKAIGLGASERYFFMPEPSTIILKLARGKALLVFRDAEVCV